MHGQRGAAPPLWAAQWERVAASCRPGHDHRITHAEPSDSLATTVRTGVEGNLGEPGSTGEGCWKIDLGPGVPVRRSGVGNNSRDPDGGASRLRMCIHEYWGRIRRVLATICAPQSSRDSRHEPV